MVNDTKCSDSTMNVASLLLVDVLVVGALGWGDTTPCVCLLSGLKV